MSNISLYIVSILFKASSNSLLLPGSKENGAGFFIGATGFVFGYYTYYYYGICYPGYY